jgi:hypothetical protein
MTDIKKQAELSTWLAEIKAAEQHLNKVLADKPADAGLEVEVSAEQVAVPAESVAREAIGGTRVSLHDVRGLNTERHWQVAVSVREIKTLK